MSEDITEAEREFLHKVTNALAIAHGAVHGVKYMHDRDNVLAGQPIVLRRIESACNALDDMARLLEARRRELKCEFAQE